MELDERPGSLNRLAVPVCSVCIANFNGETLLEACLDSVIEQQGGIAFEILVHDDASTDGSLDLLRTRYPTFR